jgi:hypothetical protein
MGSNQSDRPALDKLNWREKEPRFPGRFFYSTCLLPRKITEGKTRLTLEIVRCYDRDARPRRRFRAAGPRLAGQSPACPVSHR